MTDDVWKRSEIASPCVKLCQIHPATGLCIGCARTGEEIAAWSRMDAAERARIMAELPAREAAPRTRRGGRAARLAERG